MDAITVAPDLQRQAASRSWVSAHPLATFFSLAYAGAWLAFLPPLLAQNGLGILPFKLPLVLFLILGSFTGPALAAVVTSWLLGGGEGVRSLFRRYLVSPRSSGWYLLALIGPLAALLLISTVRLGFAPLDAIGRQPLVFVSTYFVYMLSGLFAGPLGEELGWRGFALPRLQSRLGPLAASLVLGLLWASWHLPLFAFPEWRGTGDPIAVGASFYLWVVPFTVIATWVYNSSRGSLTVATMLHTAENAAVALIAARLLPVPADPYLQFEVYGLVAILLIATTRGQLGVGSFLAEVPATSAPQQRSESRHGHALSPRRIALEVLGFLLIMYVAANIGYVLFSH
jgi:uncharacterized protein